MKDAEFPEFSVLRHNCEPVVDCRHPDLAIECPIQPDIHDAGRVWVYVIQPIHETRRQILVEEKLHSLWTVVRRSRSAA